MINGHRLTPDVEYPVGPGAILAFDDINFQVRVNGLPYQDGSAWVYECYVAEGFAGAYIPARRKGLL